MKLVEWMAWLLAFPVAGAAAGHVLRIDPAESYVNVEVHVPLQSFVAHLTSYELKVVLNPSGEITGASLTFRFTDFHTGNGEKDAHMLAWLGSAGGSAHFELEKLKTGSDGRLIALGLLEIHSKKQPVEFPVQVARANGRYTLTGEVPLDYRQWGLPLLVKVGERVDPHLLVRFRLTGAAVAGG